MPSSNSTATPASIADAARAFGYEGAAPEVLPHPWRLVRAFRVSAPGRPDAVLKSWTTTDRIELELRQLDHLAEHGFRFFARPLRTTGGRSWTEGADGFAWTAYEYIAGHKPPAPTRAAAALAGRLMRDLHATPAPATRPPSRLDALEAVLERTAPVAGKTAAALALSSREALARLPRACVHGDFNLENIIIADGGPLLIDFEFARWDARLFDFAAMVAPWRAANGAFARAPAAFLSGLAAAYGGLSADERRLFSAAAVVHALFIISDLTAANSPFTGCAVALLDHLLETPVRF